MSANRHIPGPWFAVRVKSGDFTIKAPDEPDSAWNVAETISACGYPDDHSEANARLIAAAPELLEALTLLLDRHVELVSCGDCGNWDVEREEAVIAARAALSKAEAT